jgi:ABC-type transporter MlaC component
MQNKYNDVLKIFFEIQKTKPDDKLGAIEGFRSEMNQIQQYLITKDKEMKKTTFRVSKAMRETVDVEGLADKIFGKYYKFVQGKATSPGPHLLTVLKDDK